MAALGRFLEKKVDERSDEDLKELYRQYVGSYDVLRNLSFKEILQYAGNSTAPMSAYSVSTCLLNFSTLRGHTRMLLSVTCCSAKPSCCSTTLRPTARTFPFAAGR